MSTQNSQIVIANTDGTTSVVAPETVGFKVNADGTLTGKDAKGKGSYTSKTGEASTVILTMVGTFFLATAALWGLRNVPSNIDDKRLDFFQFFCFSSGIV